MSKNRTAEESEPNYSGVVDFTVKKAQAGSAKDQVMEILKWEKREWSGAIFGCGLLFFYLTTFGGYTYLGLASVLLIIHILVSVGLNLYKQYSGPPAAAGGITVDVSSKPWSLDKEAAKNFAEYAAEEINKSVVWYTELVSGQNIIKVVQVVSVLFASWTVGTWLDGYTLLFLVFLGAFTGPVVYQKYHKEIHEQVDKLQKLVEHQIDALRSKIPKAPAKGGATPAAPAPAHAKAN